MGRGKDNRKDAQPQQFADKYLTWNDKVFHAANTILVTAVVLIVLIPLINVVASSFSSPSAVNSGRVYLWPVEFTLEGYEKVFSYPNLATSYFNTIFYTVAGTAINIALTMLAAYPLARRGLPLRTPIMLMFTFTMIFNAGMVPTYLVIKQLRIINTRWAMLLPGALSVYNTIVARTFIQNIPEDLHEAARLDGCSDFGYFFRIIIPLSGTLLSVLTVFYAVGHWNAYFNAFLYLMKRNLQPLQIILREVLVSATIKADNIVDAETAAAIAGMADLLKYSLIIVSCLPILCLYPFMQRYFAKGVMVGSLKG